MMQTLKNTMSLVVESLINKFEEDQLRKEETDRQNLPAVSEGRFNDNCSDSDSSFNHVGTGSRNPCGVLGSLLVFHGLICLSCSTH